MNEEYKHKYLKYKKKYLKLIYGGTKKLKYSLYLL